MMLFNSVTKKELKEKQTNQIIHYANKPNRDEMTGAVSVESLGGRDANDETPPQSLKSHEACSNPE